MVKVVRFMDLEGVLEGQGIINSMNMEECYLELSPWGLSKSQPPGFPRLVKPGLLL